MKGMPFLKLLLLFSIFCASPLRADFDISEIGTLGKKTLTCVMSGDELKVRSGQGEVGSGKELSISKVVRQLKKSIKRASQQIRKTKSKKQKSKKKEARSNLKALLTKVRQCQSAELPLSRVSDDGLFELMLPLDAIPDGVDPSEISVKANVTPEGFSFENTSAIHFELLPDGLQLKNPATVCVSQEETESSSMAYLMTHISGDNPQGEAGGATLEVVAIDSTDLTSEGMVTICGEIGSFSKLSVLPYSDKSSSKTDQLNVQVTAPKEVGAGETFTLTSAVQRRREIPAFTYSTFQKIDGVVTLTKVQLQMRDESWQIEGKLRWAVEDPITPTRQEHAPIAGTRVSGDTSIVESEFTCTKADSAKVYYSGGVRLPVRTIVLVEGKQHGEPLDAAFPVSISFLGIGGLECVGGSSGGGGKVCKTTELFEYACPNGSASTSVFFAAFVDPAKGTPSGFRLLDESGNEISEICPGSSSETISQIDELPSGVTIPKEEGKTPIYIRANITGGDGSKRKLKVQALCD